MASGTVLALLVDAGSGSVCQSDQFLAALRVFLNAFLLMRQRNRLVVFVSGKGPTSPLVWPRPRPTHASITRLNPQLKAGDAAGSGRDVGNGEDLAESGSGSGSRSRSGSGESSVDAAEAGARTCAADVPDTGPLLCSEITDAVIAGIREVGGRCPGRGGLAGAFAMALCHLNRVAAEQEGQQSPMLRRIMIIQSGPDIGSEYVSVMNAIFSAQRRKIPINACYIPVGDGDGDGGSTAAVEGSMLLQQACDLTEGHYASCKPRSDSLRAVLLSQFLAGGEGIGAGAAGTSTSASPSIPATVDYRAVCVCHRRPVSEGFVCSVCLGVYCESEVDGQGAGAGAGAALRACRVCGSNFFVAAPPPLRKKTKAKGLKPKGKKRPGLPAVGIGLTVRADANLSAAGSGSGSSPVP